MRTSSTMRLVDPTGHESEGGGDGNDGSEGTAAGVTSEPPNEANVIYHRGGTDTIVHVIDDPKYPTPATPQNRSSPNTTESKSLDTRERGTDAPGNAQGQPGGSSDGARDLSMQELMAIPNGAQAPRVNHDVLNEAVPQVLDTHEDYDTAAAVLFHIGTLPIGAIGNGIKWGWGILRTGRAGLAAARAGAARAAARGGSGGRGGRGDHGKSRDSNKPFEGRDETCPQLPSQCSESGQQEPILRFRSHCERVAISEEYDSGSCAIAELWQLRANGDERGSGGDAPRQAWRWCHERLYGNFRRSRKSAISLSGDNLEDMNSQKVEGARRALAELNRRFRARELVGEAFYVQMMARGFAYAECVLVWVVPDGSNTYVGKIIRQDGRVFDFDVDLDDPALSSWTDVSESFEQKLAAGGFKAWSRELLAHAEYARLRDGIEESER
jgi:hypothetical protein